MDLSCSGEDGKVLGEAVDDKKEDGGGGDDEQQPLLVPLPVLGRDHSGADGDEEAGRQQGQSPPARLHRPDHPGLWHPPRPLHEAAPQHV